ncbi:MAG: hypothetical protein ACSHXW_19500, partial [Yoonia sp.]
QPCGHIPFVKIETGPVLGTFSNRETLKWSCFLGQVCGLAKVHLVCVHAAFRVSVLTKYAMSGARLSRAV